MEDHMKYWSKRCDPAMAVVKNWEYQAVLTAISLFAGAFCSFFLPEQKQEESSESASRIMKQIVAELPTVLQSQNHRVAEPEEEKCFSDLIAEAQAADCHKLSSGLADAYKMPQGAALAIMMPAWCKFMLRSQVERLADFARKVWDVPGQELSECAVAQEGIACFQAFICRCGLAVTLREYGIRNFDSRKMAEQIIRSYGDGQKNNISLKLAEIQSIYELAKG